MPARKIAPVRQSEPRNTRSSWSELPASLLERLFVEAAGIRSSSKPQVGPQKERVCSRKVGPLICLHLQLPGLAPNCASEPAGYRLQEIMNLTSVCQNWRQACQMSVFQPGLPWTLTADYADYVLPIQLFAKVHWQCCMHHCFAAHSHAVQFRPRFWLAAKKLGLQLMHWTSHLKEHSSRELDHPAVVL